MIGFLIKEKINYDNFSLSNHIITNEIFYNYHITLS